MKKILIYILAFAVLFNFGSVKVFAATELANGSELNDIVISKNSKKYQTVHTENKYRITLKEGTFKKLKSSNSKFVIKKSKDKKSFTVKTPKSACNTMITLKDTIKKKDFERTYTLKLRLYCEETKEMKIYRTKGDRNEVSVKKGSIIESVKYDINKSGIDIGYGTKYFVESYYKAGTYKVTEHLKGTNGSEITRKYKIIVAGKKKGDK